VFELFSVPIDGRRRATRANERLPAGRAVSSFRISADGGRVFYLADQDEDDVFELYQAFLKPPFRPAPRVLSTLAPERLLDGSPLARMVAGFIALYWGGRVLVQFFWFDRSDAPPGVHVRLAEVAMVALFVALTGLYGWLAVHG